MKLSYLNTRAAGLLVAALLVGIAGCQGGDDGTHRFSGSVTFQGEPVKAGTIMLEPDAAKGNSGPASAVPIEDGKFDSDTSETGFIGGPHRVTILGFDGNVVQPDYAPHGSPLGGGRRFSKTYDFPQEDVVIDVEMTEMMKR